MQGIVITGASSGLGAHLARGYAAPGVLLGLVGRDRRKLEAVAADCRAAGAEAEPLVHDVADDEPLCSWLLALDRKAAVDLIIANAGTSSGVPPGQGFEGLASASRQVRTNLLGVMNTVEPLLPAMTARRRGRIAIIASVAGLRGLPYSPGYSASKAGARAYGEALRALLRPQGIGVSVICPGFFSSPMTNRWNGPTPSLLSLEDAAARIRRGVEKGRGRITFPFWLALGTRLTDLIPAWLGDAILRDFRFHIAEK
ncbi:MAG TPA: SDR family NAD(P)-dependent oxidoreductase [Rhizomicrobium sp.]|nr:SDR family NAD(P)-dependent oxidoreductase [Rhizomicrobium sp.]